MENQVKSWLQSLPPDINNQLYEKLIENTVIITDGFAMVQFHSIIHKIHEEIHAGTYFQKENQRSESNV
jgi:hypothetical protein